MAELCTQLQNSLVFVDADSGECDDSIEVVPDSRDNTIIQPDANDGQHEENIHVREDITLAEKLPTSTIKKLFYNDQGNLNTHKDKVKSKPLLDEKIEKGITNLDEILQKPEFEMLHPVGQEVKELLSGAVKYANESKTSLKAARELLDSSLEIYKSACESSADKFELSAESTKALAEHEKIERERLEFLIKRKSLEDANAKREEGLEMIERSIEAGKVDTVRVITKQAQEEQDQVLTKLSVQKKEIEDTVNEELDNLHLISHNCEGDIDSIERSLKTLQESAEAAFNLYTEKDQDLCLKLQQNKNEQEELRKRLEQLSKQEEALKKERSERADTQQRADQTKETAKGNLEDWKYQIEELYQQCQAALTVLVQFKEGAFKLINKSIESKEQEDKRLQELDVMAHSTYRDALVAASIDCKELISAADQTLSVVKARLEKNKADHKDALRKGVHFVAEELKTEQIKMKENYNKCKNEKAKNQLKLEQYKKEMGETDQRLVELGQVLESLEVLYERYLQEVDAAWEGVDDDDTGSLNSLEI